MEMEKAKALKRLELKKRIEALAHKLTETTLEAKRFGPRKTKRFSRNGMQKHQHRMALMSLTATRKKIYKLKAELDSLS